MGSGLVDNHFYAYTNDGLCPEMKVCFLPSARLKGLVPLKNRRREGIRA
jgi:hypothetical protein